MCRSWCVVMRASVTETTALEFLGALHAVFFLRYITSVLQLNLYIFFYKRKIKIGVYGA